jgi:hypothetical protein
MHHVAALLLPAAWSNVVKWRGRVFVQSAAINSRLIKADSDQLETPSHILSIVRRARRIPSGWRIKYGREEKPFFGCQRAVISENFAK